MPGAFGPEDYIVFFEDPFGVLDGSETAGEKREPRVSWVVRNLPNLDIVDLDWHKYNPPKALRKAPNITSQVLLDILQSSVENVNARIIEEDRQKKENEEQRQQEENEKGKSKEPYLPIIIPTEPLVEEKKSQTEPPPKIKKEILMTTFGPSVVTKADARANKRRLFALRRFFQRSDERGESSATGAALEALREQVAEAEHSREGLSLSTKPNSVEEVECVSCLDDFHPKDVIKVPCHNYCRDCFVRLVTAACQNEQQWPPKCCLNEIPIKTVLRFIPADLKKTFEERSKEWELPVSDRVYCSDPNCNLWIKPKRIYPGKRQGICDRSHITCTLCRGPAHGGEDCPQDVDMNLTNQLAEDEGWKRCFNCNALVEHREACQHMTCRCGTQFCYVCSRRWRTCTCTMDDLQALKEGAVSRRAERRAQELEEAEELRHILMQIEEFERDEALKAELLRVEQERLEEERRQRELEERVRQESIRRRDIEIKYQELRIVLDELHDLQQVLLDVDQEEEAENMIINIRAAKQELEMKHEAEMSDLKTLALAKITEKENTLNKDFRARAAEENELEEAYHERLKAYWKDKDNGDKEVENSMLALRKRMDQKHHAWQKWKADQLKVLEAKLEDNRTYREELMYSAKHRLHDSCKEKEAEMMRRMAAEKKWLEAVIVEREKLLNEWEVQEVEGDADSIFAVESEDSGDGHYVIATAS
ncbi:uncharacterized protein BKA55DRAFT_498869 [Fusarium redolens]|uniref:RBR-type E3 ubiquitin transferase n=1 Tax=Fusarium redolens TaxID=48865 RepID=A0A9P9R8K8_FUSRE|nr:uncharacterized protein BKA55DRAFT_498869 [Fusarium redolens]KAH7270366.1 hypothetical protein BKA55DRAFT_498869 [Fusarium redolens]